MRLFVHPAVIYRHLEAYVRFLFMANSRVSILIASLTKRIVISSIIYLLPLKLPLLFVIVLPARRTT